jgi:hypothetical protein
MISCFNIVKKIRLSWTTISSMSRSGPINIANFSWFGLSSYHKLLQAIDVPNKSWSLCFDRTNFASTMVKYVSNCENILGNK